ncbi:hypothetical protein O7627_08275 [Solwaraspora sp. WMMD1047]|uniref:hypothetical protein n=1 Tax=Solwaraspora sp. WMMD1047 TaxID=3016102 RepID=UPI00241599AE|nr:hypothetical protein [Solwaraspora sp. WMMD1047]MDG4829300.1 hypothetical protein [Solwaraspora sp. WMMD1047]
MSAERATTTSSAAAGLPTAQRWMIAALAAALPAHFRDRQRDEWTADLLVLSASPGGPARWRYLLGAAWTLPSLRRLAKGGRTADGGLATPATPAALTAARVLIPSVSWPLLGWLGALAVPHQARTGGLFTVVMVGAWANMIGLLAVVGMALVTLVVALLEWRRTARHRLRTAGIGMAMLFAVVVFQCLAFLPDRGIIVAMMGGAGAWLSYTAPALPRHYHIALRVIAVAGLAVAVINWTPLGAGLGSEYLD